MTPYEIAKVIVDLGPDATESEICNKFEVIGSVPEWYRPPNLTYLFSKNFRIRLKPETHIVHGKKVPAPFEPNYGDKYWCYLTNTNKVYSSIWYGDEEDIDRTKLFGPMRTKEGLILNMLAYFPDLKREDLE